MVTLLIACLLIYSLKLFWLWYVVAVILYAFDTTWKNQVVKNQFKLSEQNLILINRLIELENVLKSQ